MQEMDSFFPCSSISWRSAYIRTPYPSHRNASNTFFSIYKISGRIWESKALHDPTRLEWRAIVYGVLHPFLIKNTFPFRNKALETFTSLLNGNAADGGGGFPMVDANVSHATHGLEITLLVAYVYVCIILLKRSERKLAVALGDIRDLQADNLSRSFWLEQPYL